MATLEEQFRTALLANANLASLFSDGGSPAVSQLYYQRIGQNPTFLESPPYNAAGYFQRISTQRSYVHQGYSGLAWARMQLEIVSVDGLTVIGAVQDVLAAVAAFNGALSEQGRAANFLIGQRACQYPDRQPPLYGMQLDLKLWFNEPLEANS